MMCLKRITQKMNKININYIHFTINKCSQQFSSDLLHKDCLYPFYFPFQFLTSCKHNSFQKKKNKINS